MTVMKRIKWFVPAQDSQRYQPLGIDCEGAATLFAHHGGWNETRASDPARPSAQEIAAENRAFWTASEPAAHDQPTGLGLHRDEKSQR
ncbi:hypothetical protein [Micromonospora sp. NPDC049662]|uniref:hypothetical protein n=1 Tax=Micromonospora sp. NPDC049662 TaxID=3155397 RepID=UPI0034288207